MPFRFSRILFCLLLVMQQAQARTLHVSPKGEAGKGGTVEAPLSLNAAMELAAKSQDVNEIVLAGGEYFTAGTGIALAPGLDAAKAPPLTIRAATSQKPVLSTAKSVRDATAVAGYTNLYQMKLPNLRQAYVWESDTQTLYTALSNKGSVSVVPGSSFYDPGEETLYLHTSTGKAPSAHEVFADTARRSTMIVHRPNTTIEGLAFFGNFAGPSIDIRAKSVTVRGCEFDRCYMAVQPFEGGDNAIIEKCRGNEVAQPVISYGNDTLIRDNWFEKTRKRFLFELYPQNDTAYEIYSPGRRGTIIGNFAKGYRNGVWIKASEWPYTIRHNTIVDCHVGIMWVTGNSQSDTSHNIIVGGSEYMSVAHFDDGFVLDDNVFFGSHNSAVWETRDKLIRGANRGRRNVIADPRFVDAARGDYRLLTDSPAAMLKSKDGRPAGAFPVASFEDAKLTRPALKLDFGVDSVPFGARGDLTFEGDPWNGTGTSHVRELRPEDAPTMRLTKTGKITIVPLATDQTGEIKKTRLTLGNQQPVEKNYEVNHVVDLPREDGSYPLKVEVQNDRGIWSEARSAVIRSDRNAPKLIGQAEAKANANGVLVEFATDEPCTALLRFGTRRDKLEQTVAARGEVWRDWDANDGGNWVKTWTLPAERFAIAITRPQVPAGSTVFFQAEVTDAAGQTTVGPVQSAALVGNVRTLHVATSGKDLPGHGTKAAPFASLQYAVDRALPGDKILMAEGTYFGATFIGRGGVDEKSRITIEAEQERKVTLEAGKQNESVIHLENAPFVTIKGLRLLYAKHSCVQAYKSPHTVVDTCTLYSGSGWIKGYGFFAFYSPHCTVTRTLAVGAESSTQFLKSPYATVTHNTMSQAMYAAAGYAFDLQGIVQKYNSFAFAGNAIVEFALGNSADMATSQSDYNNYGTDVIAFEPNVKYKTQDPETWAQMEKERFKTPYNPSFFRTVSKGVVSTTVFPKAMYMTLQSWKKDSGLDKNSVFADPQYVNPAAPIDRWDWRPKPGSPNIRKDVPGGYIGAFAP